ncbi:MAG: DUF1330 domain-containing protein [Gemmatimonadota bacterium]|jgi:hypothetical protein
MPDPPPFLEPTQEAGRDFLLRGIRGEVVMLNLLRLREVADYSASPDLEPEEPISGRQAYQLYIDHTLPFLREADGRLDLVAEGGAFLIGPPDERWDLALLVRHRSVEAFLAFAQHEAYLAGIGHRLAAIEDSRLLPLVPSGAGSQPGVA